MTPGTDTSMEGQDDLRAKAPWFVSGARTRHNSMPVLQIISEPTGEVLALVPYSDRTPKAHAECYADARTIAAAPDAIEALRTLDAIDAAERRWADFDCNLNWETASSEELRDQDACGREINELRLRALELRRSALAKAEGRS